MAAIPAEEFVRSSVFSKRTGRWRAVLYHPAYSGPGEHTRTICAVCGVPTILDKWGRLRWHAALLGGKSIWCKGSATWEHDWQPVPLPDGYNSWSQWRRAGWTWQRWVAAGRPARGVRITKKYKAALAARLVP